MAKSPDHFRWRDLRPLLIAAEMQFGVKEIDALEASIFRLVEVREHHLQRLLRELIEQGKISRVNFRPCHLRKLDTLKVSTEFILI